MRDMVEAGASASNTPLPLAASLALAAHSMAVGAGLSLDCGGSLRCRANLHILGIAESGTGKSEAAKVIFAPVCEVQEERLERWDRVDRPGHRAKASILKAKEAESRDDAEALGRIMRDRESAEMAASEKGRPLLYAANVTREALAAALALAPGQAFTVMNPDARGLIGIIGGKYSGGKSSDEDIYLAGFSGDAMASLRVGSGFVNLSAPCLTVCLLIQPDAFEEMRRKAIFAESGWLQRNLMFDSKASFHPLPAVPANVPDTIMAAWRKHLCGLIEGFRDSESPALVSPSPDASALALEKANEIRARIQNGELRDVASFACRWAEQANRIALNLHAAGFSGPGEAGSSLLELRTMEKAWEIAEWYAGEQMRLMAPMREERRHVRCARLVEILTRQGPNRKLPRWKLTDNGYQEEDLMRLADAYPSRLEVGETPSGPNGGRPQKWIRAK